MPNVTLRSVLPESSCSNDAVCSQNCVRLFGVEVCSCNLGYTLDRDNVTCSGEKLLSSACPYLIHPLLKRLYMYTVRIHLAAWLNLYEDSLLSQVYRHNNNLFVCTNNMHACINICCCCITQILTSVQSHHVIKSAVTLMEGSSVSVREDMCWTRMRGAVWVAMCCSCMCTKRCLYWR